jgi:phosphoenolpyruvate-protein phosphotransferase (PTS system enzyme I)
VFSLHGTPLGGGIVIGRARKLASRLRDVQRYRIEPEHVQAEIGRFVAAIASIKQSLVNLLASLPADAPTEARPLIEIEQMLLEDPMLIDTAKRAIESQYWNAEWAFASNAQLLAEQFDDFEDEYLRERSRDVRQLAEKVLKALASNSAASKRSVREGAEPLIFVAEDIAPADMLSLKNAIGFALDLGGTTSHSAILARSMNVPTVVGLHHASELIQDEDWLILDGDAGVLIVAPDETILQQYRHRQAASDLEREKLKRLIHVPAVTLDGLAIGLMANIELPEEAGPARAAGAQGIGLFRSEFLFMNRSELPNEEEQFEAYRKAVEAMRGHHVTIRTLDIGADKALDSLAPVVAPNPALGLRAIRYSLAQPEMFLVQLRALLRASAFGSLQILIPMISHVHELTETFRYLDLAKAQLRERGQAFDEQIKVGGMIEIPAAALVIDVFMKRLDFVSIGTNDLIQYTLAIDRTDQEVASLYDPIHPAVLRLIAMTIQAGRRAGKPVAVCGEMAGDPDLTRLLIGMGLTEFSMHPASLLRVKQEVLLADAGKLSSPVKKLLLADDPEKVKVQFDRIARVDGNLL